MMNTKVRSRLPTIPLILFKAYKQSHNRSGLTAEESKNLTPRQPANDEERTILKHLREMYGCDEKEVSESTYSMFTPNAIFHDPVGIATGIGQIK